MYLSQHPSKFDQRLILDNMSQKIYNNCDMNNTLALLILKRIKHDKQSAFSCYDFTDLAPYKTVSKCLERLEDNHVISRIMPGIYCLYQFDLEMNLPILPSVDEVATCIARKHQWTICPAGVLALNMMGLSTQVPAAYEYLSSGPYKKYTIYGIPVSFKRTMVREIQNYSYISMILVQSVKALGDGRISEQDIQCLQRKLSSKEKQMVLNETTHVQVWIRKAIMSICKE